MFGLKRRCKKLVWRKGQEEYTEEGTEGTRDRTQGAGKQRCEVWLGKKHMRRSPGNKSVEGWPREKGLMTWSWEKDMYSSLEKENMVSWLEEGVNSEEVDEQRPNGNTLL